MCVLDVEIAGSCVEHGSAGDQHCQAPLQVTRASYTEIVNSQLHRCYKDKIDVSTGYSSTLL